MDNRFYSRNDDGTYGPGTDRYFLLSADEQIDLYSTLADRYPAVLAVDLSFAMLQRAPAGPAAGKPNVTFTVHPRLRAGAKVVRGRPGVAVLLTVAQRASRWATSAFGATVR